MKRPECLCQGKANYHVSRYAFHGGVRAYQKVIYITDRSSLECHILQAEVPSAPNIKHSKTSENRGPGLGGIPTISDVAFDGCCIQLEQHLRLCSVSIYSNSFAVDARKEGRN